MSTFGRIISDARKEIGLSQKELASKVKKEDGGPISPQYLNDIEHDRRHPPSEFLIGQLAGLLNQPKDFLLLAAGMLPEEERHRVVKAKPDEVAAAFRVFRTRIKNK